jgi:hypothetical protein
MANDFTVVFVHSMFGFRVGACIILLRVPISFPKGLQEHSMFLIGCVFSKLYFASIAARHKRVRVFSGLPHTVGVEFSWPWISRAEFSYRIGMEQC